MFKAFVTHELRSVALCLFVSIVVLAISGGSPLVLLLVVGGLEYLAISRFSEKADSIWIKLALILCTAPLISMLLLIVAETLFGNTQLGAGIGMLLVSFVTIPILGVGGQCAKAHAGDGDGDFQVQGFLGEAVAEYDVGATFLAVAFQRVARHAGAEQQQIVEVRQFAFGAATANVVDAGLGGALDFLDGQAIEGGRLTQYWLSAYG